MIEKDLLQKLHGLRIAVNKPVRGLALGERRSREKGNSLEFADYRNYVQGDDPRLIDWKIYARHNQFFLKTFEDERAADVHIFIDCSSSMSLNKQEKMDFAKKLGSIIGYIALNNHENVQTVFFGDQVRAINKAPGYSKFAPQVFRFIGEQMPGGKTMLLRSIKEYLFSNKHIKGIVFIISDGFMQDDISQALNILMSKKCEVAFLHLVSEHDKNPPVETGIRVIDIETGEKREVSVTKGVLERYKKAFEDWQNGIESDVKKRGARYLCIDVGSSMETVICTELRNRGILN